jgi:hypothetical protein
VAITRSIKTTTKLILPNRDTFERPTAETLLTHPFCEPDPKYNFLDTELYAKIRHVLGS